MNLLTIAEILQSTQGTLVIGDPRKKVGIEENAGVCIDSRRIRKGEIYFAIKGERFDGHHFLNEAIRKGASTCIGSAIPPDLMIPLVNPPVVVKVKDTKKALLDCAKYYRNKVGTGARIIGVCGSCGKTTVKEMIAQILSRSAPTVYSAGNFNNEIGCPLSLFSLQTDHRFGVFEIGSSALGHVKKLSEAVAPHGAVITNILLEHTETFGSLEDIAKGESEILETLPENGFAVLPQDDAFVAFLESRVPREKNIQIKSFGFSNEASVFARDLQTETVPVQFTLVHQNQQKKVLDELRCTLPSLGRLNVLNACAAAAAAFSLGIDPQTIVDGFKNFSGPEMRFKSFELKDNVTLIDDSYNANPGSMRASLESFVESFPYKKRCVVLSDMLELGEISKDEHYRLGQLLSRLPLARVVLFGPRSRFTAEGAQSSLMDEKTVTYCPDKDALVQTVRSLLQRDTAILFKASRGMRLEEMVQMLVQNNL